MTYRRPTYRLESLIGLPANRICRRAGSFIYYLDAPRRDARNRNSHVKQAWRRELKHRGQWRK